MTKVQFAIATGIGRFSRQAEYLIRSIKNHTQIDHEITIFIPRSEKSDVGNSKLSFFNRAGDITIGKLPIQNHPLSAKQAALREAEKEDSDWNILLDTDTLVLGNIKGMLDYHSESDILLSPEHGGWQHWANSDSAHKWNRIYDMIDAEFPGFILNSRFDNSPIPPYWNSGVVMSNSLVANDWIELTRDVISLYGPDLYYADQIALPPIVKTLAVSTLPNKFNYPFYMHMRMPSETKIVHYDSLWHMGRILNPVIRKKIRKLGILSDKSVPSSYSSLPAIVKGSLVRLFRELIRKQVPRLIDDFDDNIYT